MKAFLAVAVAAAITALVATGALALSTTIDQAPVPFITAGTGDMLVQSHSVPGGTLYVTTLRAASATGPVLGIATESWARRLNAANVYQIGHHYFTSNVEGEPFHGPYGDQIARHPPEAPPVVAYDDQIARHLPVAAPKTEIAADIPYSRRRLDRGEFDAPGVRIVARGPYDDQIARHLPAAAPTRTAAANVPQIAQLPAARTRHARHDVERRRYRAYQRRQLSGLGNPR